MNTKFTVFELEEAPRYSLREPYGLSLTGIKAGRLSETVINPPSLRHRLSLGLKTPGERREKPLGACIFFDIDHFREKKCDSFIIALCFFGL